MKFLPVLSCSALLLALAACGGGIGAPDLGGSEGSGAGGTAPADAGDGTEMTQSERAYALEVFDLTNEERTNRGIAPLTWHEDTAQVAYDHSVYQRGQGCISHTGEGGTMPWDRMNNAGIAWQTVGENVAVGYPTPADVVQGWMNSDGHRENILNPSYTHLGVGIEEGPGARPCPESGVQYAGPWATQVFFRPQ